MFITLLSFSFAVKCGIMTKFYSINTGQITSDLLPHQAQRKLPDDFTDSSLLPIRVKDQRQDEGWGLPSREEAWVSGLLSILQP